MPTYNDRIKCEDCETTVGNHKWAKIRACADGWLIMFSGQAYCPRDQPLWAESWRDKRKANARTNAQ